jgi:hypothetical protein
MTKSKTTRHKNRTRHINKNRHKNRTKKYLNPKTMSVSQIIRELKKLNKSTNVLKSNITRNSRKISNLISNLKRHHLSRSKRPSVRKY